MRKLNKLVLFFYGYFLITRIGVFTLRKQKIEGNNISLRVQGESESIGNNKGSKNEIKNACKEKSKTYGNVTNGGGTGEHTHGTQITEVQGKEEKNANVYKKNDENLQNFVSTKDSYMVENEKRDNEILSDVVIPEDAFQSAKSLCEYVVIKSDYFKTFCKMTPLFKEIQQLKKKDPHLYAQISGESYENDDTSNFQVLKDDGDKKIVMEADRHNPKISIFFLFQKMCVGGIPLACTNILKIDNVFDVNQNVQQNENDIQKMDMQEMENEITDTSNERTGNFENVADLTEEGS
ncbi:rhoptry neck protein 12 [Plasmodium gonderi]|uniref:Rhoptry neck protein 12 n=1 Tax=Plasmodium gonderi TaxID=77519 RepID=A0A1Y1JHG5_PLAGO|nr:rhoptry neck protein 12 [Plasmodium gonderi]GAW79873.1 rhoptry neck protein 12 [Plasmodium gonderi]